MIRVLAAALALTSALVPQGPTPSPTASPADRAELILSLRRTRPDLAPLREAVRDRDPAKAANAVARARAEASSARAKLVEDLEALGCRVVEQFWLIDACLVEAPAGIESELERLEDVRAVRHNGTRAPGDARLTTAPIRTSTNLDNHGTDAVQIRGVRGAGATVAVIDSGLDSAVSTLTRPHRTFFVNGDPNNTTGGGLSGSRMLANVQIGAFPADDPIDHGTRVAGVAVGARWNTTPAADDGHAPRAQVVGYAMVDLAGGLASLATMIRSWQACALDAAIYGTTVAVISYDGTDDPTSPEQQAMDACAEVADICVAAMAGNNPRSSLFYQGATNVLAVGAVAQDTHVVTNFTARGPLTRFGRAPRVYPHLVANGDLIEMPTADREATSVMRSGTSYSAPQVAGAAALFRSVLPTASADETRAAILATVADGRGPNPNDLDAIGHGYLRVDRLVDLAQNRIAGTIARGQVSMAAPAWTTTLTVTAGQTYAAALAFSRTDVALLDWANLDLRVTQNGTLLAESNGIADTHERVVFRPDSAGTVTIEVRAVSFEPGRLDQAFGVAAARVPLPFVTAYGQGCFGSRGPSTVQEVEPRQFTTLFGNSASNRLIGGPPHRTQQWIATATPSAAFYVRGLAMRRDEATGSGPWNAGWVELDARIGLTMAEPNTASSTFDTNLGPYATQVIRRKRFVLPSYPAPNAGQGNFDVVLPLDQSFSRQYDPVGPTPGGIMDLIVDARTYASSGGAQGLNYPLDAVTGLGPLGAVTLHAASPTATTGTLFPGEATVIGLVGSLGAQRFATIDAEGLPSMGNSYDLVIRGATPLSPVLFGGGSSRTTWAGTPLPVDLAVLGAPGCFVLNDLEAAVPVTADATGTARATFAVPNIITLRGREAFHQGIVFDPSANLLGVTTTSGIGVVFGQ
ncbi:MAG: S8/S53 family peptidase [Planctomycetota bacterium]|nr:S8/S53 family peptidase [Planctomycetota bacterium]